ncbi:glutamate dehydrogenase N terminal-domain containing protein, partial [Mesorhizobium sp. M1C.F.Ca.ET.176.01.1.1]|uniref:glutamate dehydrogenase N terminal-domain containing protein n=1 Tax=Mesorhizobium sp. M1C.F.Ca.ET.176.01.1.1 TaxID=2563922 RepID=UPI001AEF00D6
LNRRLNRSKPESAYSVLQQGLFAPNGYNFIFPTEQAHRSAMKPQKTAAKTVKNKTKPAESEVAVTAGFSLEPVYTALRKRYPAAAQAEAVAFA